MNWRATSPWMRMRGQFGSGSRAYNLGLRVQDLGAAEPAGFVLASFAPGVFKL